VVACYNQRHFVQAAVESAISQPHPSKEVIVVDDASSDGTPEVLDEFGDSIRLVKFAKNQGALATRNHGSSLATGEYLVFLDGDDILMPWTLQVYERLIAALSPKIILGQRLYFYQGEVPRAAAEDFPRKIDFVDYPCWFQKDRMVAFGASNTAVHRKTFWDAGGWSPGIFHLDVTDLLLKLGLAGRTLVILAPPTVWYRKHSTNITHSVAGMLRCAKVLLQKERAGEYPGGRKHWFARSTCLGGPMWFWIRRAVEAGLYVEAMKLAGSAWFTILAAIVRRFVALGRGLRPVQSMELLHD
jgi:glycosyltransferase involved in cell wall biosynthesis